MTIKDVAKICGVSVSTVSRVLNDRPDVNPEVRRHVLNVVAREGYVPSSTARNLVGSRSNEVGVVVRGMGNPGFFDMLDSISRELEHCGYTMVLHQIRDTHDEIKAGSRLERERKLRGLLFLGGRYDHTPGEMAQLHVPYVCCGSTDHYGSLPEEDQSWICADVFQTVYEAAGHLLKQGHSRIALLIPGCEDHGAGQLCFESYQAVLKEWNVPFDGALVMETGSSEMSAAYKGMGKLLDHKANFTAVLTLSDGEAIAAMKALADGGHRVPEDCSVIAIDGTPISEYTIPALTAMIPPAQEIGREAVRMLADRIKHGTAPGTKTLQARLRAGGSVRKT